MLTYCRLCLGVASKSCQAVKGGVSELPDSSLGCQNRVINVCPVKRKCYSSVWQLGCLKDLFALNLGSRWNFFMTCFVFLITNQE